MSPSHVFVGRLSDESGLDYKHVESGHPKESGVKHSTIGSYLRNTRSSQREKLDVEFLQKIGALTSEIERTTPNPKALDQYEDLLEKERVITKEFGAAPERRERNS
ncbi:hypothetical protein U1Q18_002028 [Sarracenia purpurea var. burkii]